MSAIASILLAGIWHVSRLRRGGSRREAGAAAVVWALALAGAALLVTGLPVPTPLAALERLFRGLSDTLRSF